MKNLAFYKSKLNLETENKIFDFLISNLKLSNKIWSYFVNLEKTLETVLKKDFIYFNLPYYLLNKTSGRGQISKLVITNY